jgi:hypothetical protein
MKVLVGCCKCRRELPVREQAVRRLEVQHLHPEDKLVTAPQQGRWILQEASVCKASVFIERPAHLPIQRVTPFVNNTRLSLSRTHS